MAFWKGAILGAAAGAAYALWIAPGSGSETRARIAEEVETVLFDLTGMPVWRPESAGPPPEAFYATAANPAEWDGNDSR